MSAPTITREEFEQQYAPWIGASEDDPELRTKLADAGLVAISCDCGEPGCKGLRMHMGPPDLEKLFEKLRPAFEELGAKMAYEREKRFMEAILK
jgi:hypothetical protein